VTPISLNAPTLSVKQMVCDHDDVRREGSYPAAALNEVPALVNSALPSPSLCSPISRAADRPLSAD
jgi:hypothetical protein